MAIKPYLQLVRLPNVFTAGADSLAGWLLVGGALGAVDRWLPLVLASACTYAGGIALNDVFDYEVDLVERPNRPLPSGRIGRRFALLFGFALLAAGFLLAALSRTMYGVAVESALIACVLAYDTGAKRTVLGPEVMGACRGLNLLLGMSVVARFGGPVAWLAAISYGLFVTGVTWISRSEVQSGRSRNLYAGLFLQNAAFLGLIATIGGSAILPDPLFFSFNRQLFGCVALVALEFAVSQRTLAALRTPRPETIQAAVKFGIMSMVWIHVGLLLGIRGLVPAIAVALFWIPAATLGRWIYST